MNAQDGRAMFELQLELHSRATGVDPLISADDLLEVHELLTTHEGDLKSIFSSGGKAVSPKPSAGTRR